LSCIELDAEGLILGVKKDVLFEQKTLQVEPGDILLMYTDGIVETQNRSGEFFGEWRLCNILGARQFDLPEQLIDHILDEVALFSDFRPLQDDVSMVVLQLI
jgi:sigma-B regulation protein RsbU (phosphoserine phosphatase)